MKILQTKTLLLCVALALSTSVRADERESLETLRAATLNLIKALVQQGVLTQDKADEIVRQATVAAPAGGTPGAGDAGTPASSGAPVRVPYVPEFVKRELREQIKSEVIAQAKSEGWADSARLPDWLERFRFRGDLTLRFEDETFRQPCDLSGTTGVTTSCNVPAVVYNQLVGTNLSNTTANRQLTRLRATEGVDITINSHTQAEFSLSTGSLSNPVTNFQTLGNTFSRPTIGLDRGNVRYQPIEWLQFTGGRFSNPFFGSDLLWYDRLGFDGLATRLQPRINDHTALFATLGAFPVQDFEPNPTSLVKPKWLYGFQAGGEFRLRPRTSLKLGIAYYDFTHVEGRANDASGNNNFYGNSVPQFSTKGNTLFNINQLNGGTAVYAFASKFRELNFTMALDIGEFESAHVVWLVDVAKNIGFDANEINLRAGGGSTTLPIAVLDPRYGGLIRPRINAFNTRLTAGASRIARAGEWQGYLGYKYVERDSVLDAFTDPDFHLGGTDAKGWIAGASVGLDRNTWLSLKYLSAQAIDGLPLTVDVMQADFNVRF